MIQTVDTWSLKDTTVIQQDDSILIVKIEDETKVFFHIYQRLHLFTLVLGIQINKIFPYWHIFFKTK